MSPLSHRADKAGMSPGTLVHVGEKKTDQVIISLLDYDFDGGISQLDISNDLSALSEARETDSVTWVDVMGLHDTDKIGAIGEFFNIHSLLLEDILNTDQRPKLEQFDQYTYIILKDIDWDGENVDVEQISIVLGKSFVLTFQETAVDAFGALRNRLSDQYGRIRRNKADYLAYGLLDNIVDQYFVALEEIGDKIEVLEDEMILNPEPETLQNLHDLKRQLIFLRRGIWPLREVLGQLQRGESLLFQESTLIYLRDVYEHTIQVIDTVETYRELVSGLQDIYLSSISQRTNEVMQVLTVLSTIFMPLTFITGLYGMNFTHMPELAKPFAYPIVWIVMIGITGAQLYYFRRKQWL